MEMSQNMPLMHPLINLKEVLVDCRISFRSEEAQASIESALILPIALLCIGLALQPLLYMYTKSLCMQAAQEGIRFAMSEENDVRVKRYVLRRLQAIAPVGIVHSGSDEDWNIEVIRSGKSIRIEIDGSIKELPLLGLPSRFYLPHDGENLKVEVEAENSTVPVWREGTYDEWVGPFR